jgi:RNA polymerase sigma factor (TIGR02999 family)
MDPLTTQVYDELRVIARALLRSRGPAETLQPTALVHEAWLKLGGRGSFAEVDRGRFFALAAKAMRQLVVDHARRRGAAKRGGAAARVGLDEGAIAVGRTMTDALDVHEALETLSALDPVEAQVVELRYFGGLQIPEIAETLGISVATVEREWRSARAWLAARLGPRTVA